MDYYKKIEDITKCNHDDHNFLLRYLSRLPIFLRVDIEKKRKKTFHFLKEKYPDMQNEVLSYSAHILSIRSQYSTEKNFTSKKFDNLTIDEIRDLSTLKINTSYEKNYLNKSPKRSKLLHYWAIVKECRGKKPKPMSFVKISKHLNKTYNFSIGHNLIAQLWRELETNTIEKDR